MRVWCVVAILASSVLAHADAPEDETRACLRDPVSIHHLRRPRETIRISLTDCEGRANLDALTEPGELVPGLGIEGDDILGFGVRPTVTPSRVGTLRSDAYASDPSLGRCDRRPRTGPSWTTDHGARVAIAAWAFVYLECEWQ